MFSPRDFVAQRLMSDIDGFSGSEIDSPPPRPLLRRKSIRRDSEAETLCVACMKPGGVLCTTYKSKRVHDECYLAIRSYDRACARCGPNKEEQRDRLFYTEPEAWRAELTPFLTTGRGLRRNDARNALVAHYHEKVNVRHKTSEVVRKKRLLTREQYAQKRCEQDGVDSAAAYAEFDEKLNLQGENSLVRRRGARRARDAPGALCSRTDQGDDGGA